MRIAIFSHFFHPSIGGTEEVGQILADQFTRLGHKVKVITTTPQGVGGPQKEFPFEVIRRPNPCELWRAVKWSEAILHNNICLQMAWPLLLLRRPWVVAHHIWIRRVDGSRGIRDRLKFWAIKFAKNIAVSRALASDLPVQAEVIGNPYREHIYFNTARPVRDERLLFVGRLIRGKGVDLLIEALRILKGRGKIFGLRVLGEGPERERLMALAHDLPVEFEGIKTLTELAQIFNQHRVLVIPSMWDETFGLIALEGIACGCRVIGASDGGLPEAIGPCGRIFPRGDANALADLIEKEGNEEDLLVHAEKHLSKHRAEAVAKAYLKVIAEAMG